MGPIEQELSKRWPNQRLACQHMSDGAWSVTMGAWRNLNCPLFDTGWPDIMSEAIEAAEALGL